MSLRSLPEFSLAAPGLCAPGRPGPFRLAAPSWVFPGTVAENAAWLAGRVDEVALLLFETRACLEYGPADLPPGLADLPLSWHAHLPLDLPWDQGAPAVARTVATLAGRIAFLRPRAFVLHPPPDPALLAPFVRLAAEQGLAPSSLLVENTVRENLPDIWDELWGCGCGVCLDLGHLLLAGNAEQTLGLRGLFTRTSMLHVSAPARGGHGSLALLDPAGRALLRRLLEGLTEESTVVLELFDPAALAESAGLLRQWGTDWSLW